MNEWMNEWHKRTVNIYGKLAVVVAKIHFKKWHDNVSVIMGFILYHLFYTYYLIKW